MRRALIAFSFLCGGTLLACGLAGDDAASQEADHTAGEPTFAQESWLWADESEAEFRASAAVVAADPNNGMGSADFLPLDHPMTKRLQIWTDRFDADLRARYPEKMKATPHPQVIISKSDTLNAWVSALPVAWKVKTRVAGEDDAGVPDAHVDADASVPVNSVLPATELYVERTGAVWTAWGETVFDRPHDAQKIASFVRFHNQNFSKCRLESNGEEIVFSELCAPPPGGLPNRRGDKLAYYATAKYVTFTSGYILRMLTEDRVVATLAHELGHFYRSHPNMPTDVVNYFYSLDAAHAHTPPADPRTIEQTARVREKIRNGEVDYAAENALMKERNLGFYTIEQEADEIALELLANIGVPPNVAMEVDLESLKMEEESGWPRAPGDLGWAECMMLRDQAFRDADGKIVSPPVGDPNDAHHNGCFRVFNMQRELQAHRYQLGTRAPIEGPQWSALITQLGNDAVPSPPPPPPAETDAGSPADAGAD
jgi:hypothetical protein